MRSHRTSRAQANRNRIVSGIYHAIDYSTAILLLSGQVTAGGVFLSPGGFWLSLSGPVIGGIRMSGRSVTSGAVLDTVDIVTALLLICGQLTVTGPWISSKSFTIVVSGPAFGIHSVPVPSVDGETFQVFSTQFRALLVRRFAELDAPEGT